MHLCWSRFDINKSELPCCLLGGCSALQEYSATNPLTTTIILPVFSHHLYYSIISFLVVVAVLLLQVRKIFPSARQKFFFYQPVCISSL